MTNPALRHRKIFFKLNYVLTLFSQLMSRAKLIKLIYIMMASETT